MQKPKPWGRCPQPPTGGDDPPLDPHNNFCKGNEKNKLSDWLLDPSPASQHRWVTARPIAHRGLFDPTQSIPENSLAAFQRAVDQRYSIELDVRLLSDGQPAVFHDRDLWRMTGQQGSVHTLTTEKFRNLRLILDNQPPPLLEDVFRLVGDKVGVLVEIKDPTPQAAQAVALAAKGHNGPWAALSFHAGVIAWFARHHPHITRGLNGGVFEWEYGFLPAVGMRSFFHAAKAKPHFLSCYLKRLGDPIPRWLRSRGLPVITWTARTPQDWQTAKNRCDAVIFENFLNTPDSNKLIFE